MQPDKNRKDENGRNDADKTEEADAGEVSPQPADMMDEFAETETAPARNDTIAVLEQELAQAKDQLLRVLAESDNVRKRLTRERDDTRKFAVADFARDMLVFADNFRRALESIPADLKAADARIAAVIEGIHAMEKELVQSFGKHGIKKIDPVGEPFNPNFHEVMFETPAPDAAPGTVVHLIEPGYMLHDRLLRPARVGIAQNGTEKNTGEPGTNLDREV